MDTRTDPPVSRQSHTDRTDNREYWLGDGLRYYADAATNPDTGLAMGPDQGTVTGARIDAAVTHALAAFWRTIADRFPEATTGDMSPGDTDALENAAADAARIWIMWNHPEGMPE